MILSEFYIFSLCSSDQRSINITECSRYVVTNSKDQTIKIWDLRRFASESGVVSLFSLFTDYVLTLISLSLVHTPHLQNDTRESVGRQRWDYRWHGVPQINRALTPGTIDWLIDHSLIDQWSGWSRINIEWCLTRSPTLNSLLSYLSQFSFLVRCLHTRSPLAWLLNCLHICVCNIVFWKRTFLNFSISLTWEHTQRLTNPI